MEPISIQSDIIYVNENTPQWTLHQGKGERSYKGIVQFAAPFEIVPHVIISLAEEEEEVDEDYDEYADYEEEPKKTPEIPVLCSVEEVSPIGFKYKISTWGNNKVREVAARWIAMAQYKAKE